MKINNITFTNEKVKKRPILNTQNTGYIATVGVGLAMLTGVAKGKNLRKSHKYFAAFAAVSVIGHIFSVEHYKRIFKSKSLNK